MAKLGNWMEQIVISDDDASDEAVPVPPFVPSPPREPLQPAKSVAPPLQVAAVEIAFSNLTKDSCRRIKDAFSKWAEWQTASKSASPLDETLLSGKFRFESDSKGASRIVFLPERRDILADGQLKQPIQFNGAVEKMFESPLYLRTFAQLPTMDGTPPLKQPVQNQQCFNCGSYHHQARKCKRPPMRRLRPDARRSRGSQDDYKRPPPQLLTGGRAGAAPHKRLRTEKGTESKGSRFQENGIPRVKIGTDSDSHGALEGLEDGEVIEQRKKPESRPKPVTPVTPVPVSAPPQCAVMEGGDEIEEGEIVEPKPPPPQIRFQTITYQPQRRMELLPHPLESVLHTPYPPPPPPPPPANLHFGPPPVLTVPHLAEPPPPPPPPQFFCPPEALFAEGAEHIVEIPAPPSVHYDPPPPGFVRVPVANSPVAAPAVGLFNPSMVSYPPPLPPPPPHSTTEIVFVDNQGKVIYIPQQP